MTGTLKVESNERRHGAVAEEAAFLSLLTTADLLSRKVEQVLKAAGVSPTQYNVLRILRGSPEGLPCREVADRMINRDPDITRLLDRMEKRHLISRTRETRDRRLVVARITPPGLRLLAELDSPVRNVHRSQLGHLGRDRLRTLLQLLEMARQKVR